MDSRAFYDDLVGRQLSVGVNARHRRILEWALRFGLSEGHRVLEIGSGVGSVTGLLASAVGPDGHVFGVDLSPKSIDAARERLAEVPNVRLEAGDILDMDIGGRYDVIVLPDVIEHIPLELHARLFERLAAWVEPDGFILLHYPNPLYLAWMHEHEPELLQHVDQPVEADGLLAHAYRHGLYLRHLETYTVWIDQGDYVAALLKPRPEAPTFTEYVPPPPSLGSRIGNAMRRLLGSKGVTGERHR